jgi:hypothetical protein
LQDKAQPCGCLYQSPSNVRVVTVWNNWAPTIWPTYEPLWLQFFLVTEEPLQKMQREYFEQQVG